MNICLSDLFQHFWWLAQGMPEHCESVWPRNSFCAFCAGDDQPYLEPSDWSIQPDRLLGISDNIFGCFIITFIK
jgi:hypothetical protein